MSFCMFNTCYTVLTPRRSTEVNSETTNAILEGCKSLAPELLARDGSFEVLSVQCGLRPGRENGPVRLPWPIIPLFKPIGSPKTLSRDPRAPPESIVLTWRNTTEGGGRRH